MKHILCSVAVAGAFSAMAVSPLISNVEMTQNRKSRQVTVSYELSGEDAVVTLSIETNSVVDGVETPWVKIPAEFGAGSGGHEMFTLVKPGRHEFSWNPVSSAIFDTKTRCRAVVRAWSKLAPPDYMVVKADGTEPVRYYEDAVSIPGGVGDRKYKSTHIVMRRIHAAGVETRLGEAGEGGENSNRTVPRMVSFTRDYYIGIYECTQGQYKLFSGGVNPSNFKGAEDSDYRPVESLTTGSRDPINAGLLNTIGTLASQTGVAFTLPSEAQWEYAARGGLYSPLPNGKGIDEANLADIAWWYGNSESHTHEVGLKEPNGYGMYDVVGNVWEICRDGWKTAYSDGKDAIDPVVADADATNNEVGTACSNTVPGCPGYHSRRGGSWENRSCSAYARINGRYACEWRATWWGSAYGCGFRLCAPCEAK